MNFSRAKAADLTAAWIREHTNGNPSPSTRTNESIRMAILNAVYYKARFDTEPDKKDTKKGTFYAQDDKVDIDFVHEETGSYSLTDSRDYTITSLTLSSSSSLTLVLPKEGKDVHKTMEQKGFLQELLKDDTGGADFGIVKPSLPKLKARSKLQLADTLEAMGITSLFDITAKLNGITNERPFFVSDIQQGTSVALNEEGTEASVYIMVDATGATNMEHPKASDLNLNRSLLYMTSIRMGGTKLSFFIGARSNPASQVIEAGRLY